MEYSKAASTIKNAIAKGGEPLTEGQFMLMAGAIAVLLEQAKAEQRESDYKAVESLPEHADIFDAMEAIRNNKE